MSTRYTERCPRHGWALDHLECREDGITRHFACGCFAEGFPPLDAFARACLGPGAPGEPTPLEALQHLMDAFILGDRLPAAEWDAVERLARELRAAVGKAEGKAP